MLAFFVVNPAVVACVWVSELPVFFGSLCGFGLTGSVEGTSLVVLPM